MAIRVPSTLVTSYSDSAIYPREPIVTTHWDAILDNQEYVLRAPRLYVSECFFPIIQSTSVPMVTQWRTSFFTRHKCGATFGTSTIGKVYVLTYEADSSLNAPTTGTYDISITDGTNTDTTTVSTFSATADWLPMTISTVVATSDDMSARTDIQIKVGNFVSSVPATDVAYVYLCGIMIYKT